MDENNSERELARQFCQPRNGKLTEGKLETVVSYTMKGIPSRFICAMIGISTRTYRQWRQWGREGKGDIYERFETATRSAEAYHAMRMAEQWNNAARNGDWRAAKSFLESRYPEDYGKARHQPQPPPVVINVTLSPGLHLLDAIPPDILPFVQVHAIGGGAS